MWASIDQARWADTLQRMPATGSLKSNVATEVVPVVAVLGAHMRRGSQALVDDQSNECDRCEKGHPVNHVGRFVAKRRVNELSNKLHCIHGCFAKIGDNFFHHTHLSSPKTKLTTHGHQFTLKRIYAQLSSRKCIEWDTLGNTLQKSGSFLPLEISEILGHTFENVQKVSAFRRLHLQIVKSVRIVSSPLKRIVVNAWNRFSHAEQCFCLTARIDLLGLIRTPSQPLPSQKSPISDCEALSCCC